MSSVNKVLIVGMCGRDPEVRYLPSGQAVANVSVATSTKRKNKETGETIEDTQWHRITFYDRLAEIASEYVKKGRQIYVEGRLKYGKYTDQAGVEKNTVDIVATELQLLGGGQGNQGGGQQGGNEGGNDGYGQNNGGGQRPQGQRPAPQGNQGGGQQGQRPAPQGNQGGGQQGQRPAPQGNQGGGQGYGGGNQGNRPPAQNNRPAPAPAASGGGGGYSDMDDDIPF
jgi:single-strand DNA-binding protein